MLSHVRIGLAKLPESFPTICIVMEDWSNSQVNDETYLLLGLAIQSTGTFYPFSLTIHGVKTKTTKMCSKAIRNIIFKVQSTP